MPITMRIMLIKKRKGLKNENFTNQQLSNAKSKQKTGCEFWGRGK